MTKKIIFAFLLLFTTGQLYAQRNIRLPERPNRPAYIDHSEKDDGFWCALEGNVGSSIVFNHDNTVRAGLSFIGGYMVNEYLKLGLGIGGNCYTTNNDVIRDTSIEWTMPLYFDARGNIVTQETRNFVPYWSVDIGGAIRDGFFFSPTIGMRIGQKRDSWLLGLSYTVQQIDAIANYPETISIVSLKLGYEF